MPEITDEEMEELDRLRHWYKRQQVLESVRASDRLEDDIDAPIKKCVMALALLGSEPRWSCCGFDYENQPIHKDHIYGGVGFTFRYTTRSHEIISRIISHDFVYVDNFKASFHNQDGVQSITIYASIERGKMWTDLHSIHYGELGATTIGYLEDFLLSMSNEFSDEIVLRDTNAEARDKFPSWQYPPKRDWVIRKSDLLKEMECQLASATYAEAR